MQYTAVPHPCAIGSFASESPTPGADMYVIMGRYEVALA